MMIYNIAPRVASAIASRHARINASKEAAFVQSLADLLEADVDLPWALQTVGTLTKDSLLRQSCEDQAQALMQGQEWTDVLGESMRPVWSDTLKSWARIGINTGALVDCLRCYHQQWSVGQAFAAALGRKLSYPAGVLCLSLVLTWFTGSQFQPDSHQTLWLSLAVGGCAALLATGAVWQFRRRYGVAEMRCWNNCLKAAALMMKAGFSWTRTLDTISVDLPALWAGKRTIGASLQDCAQAVRNGRDIHTAAEDADLPDSLLRSLKLAQLSGDLPGAVLQSANLFDLRRKSLEQQMLSTLPSAALALAAATLAVQYALFIQPLYAQLGQL